MSDEISNFWSRVSDSTGVPLAGIRFVYDVFDHMRPGDAIDVDRAVHQRAHCTAAEYCEAFARLARDKFGADHAAALYSWNLETSEKLGRLFYALIDQGLMGKQESDRQSEFEGQFDFSRAVGEPPPTSPFDYAGRTPEVVFVQPTTWQPWSEMWWVAALVGCAFAVTATLSEPLSPTSAFILAYGLVIGLVVLRSSIRYPYRFSLRALLATMTVIALMLGMAAYFAR